MTYSFGSFMLDPVNGTMRRGGEPVPLGHRAATLLQVLFEAEGQPVTKSALLEAA